MDSDCTICGTLPRPVQMLWWSIYSDHEWEINYDTLGVHVTCDMGLIRGTNREKEGEKQYVSRTVGGEGVP